MSDIMRWRYGDTSPVVMAVEAETVVQIGDLVYLDNGAVKPASAAEDLESEEANQGFLHDGFVGVAMQRSRAGDVSPIRIATSGVFEFGCAALTFEVGDLIGGKEAAGGTQLENQVVAKVDATNLAIGRCVRRSPDATTSVLVDIVSTVVKGGPMPPPPAE